MKGLLTIWQNRIAPVFSASRKGLIIEHGDYEKNITYETALPEGMDKTAFILDLKIDYLVCGAIWHPLRKVLERREIRVYGFTSGSVNEILEACLTKRLQEKAFTMPGCGSRGRCCRRKEK